MTVQYPFQRWLLAFAAFALALSPLTAAPPPPGISLQTEAAGNYLILSADLFAGRLDDFAALKQAQGYAVTLVYLSQIGGNTQQYIQDYVKSWYVPDPNLQQYLLLVGDSNFIPVWQSDHGTGTDLYYATMGGPGDDIPDLYAGRLPFRNTADLDQWVSKILAYEQNKADETWPKRASFIATDSPNFYQAVEQAHNKVVADHMVTNFNGSFPNDPQPGGDKLYPRTYGATNADVKDGLNAGPALAVYNGLGSSTAWLGPAITQKDVRELTGPPVPLVLSLANSTSDFSEIESLADTWVMRPGSGALTFIGSSSPIAVIEHQIELEKQIFLKLFETPADPATLGQALHYGLKMVGERYPENARQYWQDYQLFGDPSLQIALEPNAPDYALALSPDRLSLCGDGQAQTSLQVIGRYGFDSPVTLFMEGLPSGMSCEIQPDPIRPGETAVLTITASGLDLGSYLLTVRGVGDSLVRTAELLVTIDGRAPGAVTLLEPPAFFLNAPLRPRFSWEASPDAASYEIEIASDHLFQSIGIAAGGLTAAEYVPSDDLSWGATYWWRVRGVNHCGPGAYSLPRRFTTQSAGLACPGGTPVESYATDFESGGSGWSTAGIGNTWALKAADSFSPVWSFFASSDLSLPGEQTLVSPSILLPGLDQAPIKLGFWSRHSFENAAECKDGGLLEISTDGGVSWQAIPESRLLSIPYDGVISSAHHNPLGGSSAWCGEREWSHFVVNLDDYHDQQIRLRWRLGTDDSTPEGEGWYIDDVAVQSCWYPPPPGVTLEPASAQLTGSPGETLIYTLRAANTGPEAADFELAASGFQWPTEIEPALLRLEPGQSGDVTVTVLIPEDAGPDDFDRANIDVFYVPDHAVNAGAVLETRVRLYRLSLSSPQAEARGRPGDEIRFSVQVTNAGNVPDTVDLHLSSLSGWAAGPLTGPLELAAGQTEEVLVTAVIPLDAADGTREELTLEAISRGDPRVSARIALRGTAAWPRIYLPLMMSR